MAKFLQGYKTLVAAASIVLSVLSSEQVQAWVSQHPGEAASIVGAIMVVCRLLTTTPLPFLKSDASSQPQ